MRKYSWRNNVTTTLPIYKGKMACKTENTDWLQTEEQVVVLVSIFSKFHSTVSGELKMSALMKSIKDHVKGKVTVLMADAAHTKEAANSKEALAHAILAAKSLEKRYAAYFAGCRVVYWHDFICKNASYLPLMKYVQALYKNDVYFQECIRSDAPEVCSAKVLDLLEQCTCQLVLAKMGYRYLFYPGPACRSTEYIMSLLAQNHTLCWINVFVSIERKVLATPELLHSQHHIR